MADPTKAWEKAFNQGSKALQDRLKKVHANNPAFQSWLKSAGHDVQGSVKQSVTYKTSERLKRLQAQSKSGAGYDLKDPEVVRDTIVPLSKDQRAKVAEIERQKKAAEKAAKPAKPKRVVRPPAPKKPLTRDERMAAISKAVAKAKSKSRFDVPTIDPNDADAEDYRDLHKGLHVGGTYNEETQKEEPPFTPDKKKVRRGPGGPMSQAKWLAKQAMLKQTKNLKKEEVEQVVEQDDSTEKKEMAETQLHFIKYAAEEILEFIKMGGEIEEWYQNKLSKVQSEVESLHSYIEGEKRRTGMVEEVEQVDEKINLVKAKMGDVVKDFYKSKAPQFKGKSMAKRREMAVAAKLGAEREAGMREEVEQVDEVKAVKAYDKEGKLVGRYRSMDHAKQMKPGHTYKVEEEVEQIDEMDKSQPAAGRDSDTPFPTKPIKVTDKQRASAKLMTRELLNQAKKQLKKEEVVTEAEGKVAVTPKEKELAAHHGDKTRITRGDVIKARLKSVAAKKMGK